MARTTSIILTKEEKKAQIADLKSTIKATNNFIKQNGSVIKASEKAHASTVKETDKQIKALTKTLAGLQAKLSVLAPATV